MAPIRGNQAKLYIDEFDFSGAVNSVTVDCTRSVLDGTNLASTGFEKIPNIAEATIEHNGFYTGPGAGQIFEELRSRLGGAAETIVAVTLGVVGVPAVVLPTTWAQQLKLDMPVNDLITLMGSWPSHGMLHSGLLIARASITAVGNQTSIDFGAAASAGGVAYLFVQAVTGTANNAVFKIRSATTQGGSYADKATFDVDGVGAQSAALSGTVNRWVQLYCENMGGATGFTVACIVGLSGINY